ncbi:3-phosphoinoside dependent protein kinase [Scenedesmus sp. NREL 46B-D3]|nr:3-phosphoinoside dependent protein kinase [Scenedesmus sp. NREL 46B-D3]
MATLIGGQQQQQQQAINSSGHGESLYNAPRLQIAITDFEFIQRLGDGSFSTVVLGRYNGDGRCYAVKIVNKSVVLRNKMADYIRNERNVLDRLHHPGIAQLQFTFQDAESLYIGLEHCPNGELYEQLQARGPLPLCDAVQYAAEIVDVLAYLRSMEVMHRDLKPENLLLDAQGRLKLIDFGSAKALFLPPTVRLSSNHRATSFVGTAEYVSPEVLNNAGISYTADLWALGCIVYQMLTGRPPFKGASEYLTFQLITSRDLSFPEGFPAAARDLVESLLQLEPSERLGHRSIAEVQQHPFFAGVNWAAVRSAPAPQFVPPQPPNPDDAALDWEFQSLVRNAAPPIKYEYLPSGATV